MADEALRAALILLDEEVSPRCVRAFESAASIGDPLASGFLLARSEFNEGICPKLEMIRAHVVAGDPAAMALNAFFFAFVDGSEARLPEAVELLRKSASLNCCAAQYLLGSMYVQGLGVPSDEAQAGILFAQAAAGGHLRARLERALRCLDSDSAAERGMDMLRECAADGYLPAQVEYGRRLLESGPHTPELEEGLTLLQIGCSEGSVEALCSLADWYQTQADTHMSTTKKGGSDAEDDASDYDFDPLPLPQGDLAFAANARGAVTAPTSIILAAHLHARVALASTASARQKSRAKRAIDEIVCEYPQPWTSVYAALQTEEGWGGVKGMDVGMYYRSAALRGCRTGCWLYGRWLQRQESGAVGSQLEQAVGWLLRSEVGCGDVAEAVIQRARVAGVRSILSKVPLSKVKSCFSEPYFWVLRCLLTDQRLERAGGGAESTLITQASKALAIHTWGGVDKNLKSRPQAVDVAVALGLPEVVEALGGRKKDVETAQRMPQRHGGGGGNIDSSTASAHKGRGRPRGRGRGEHQKASPRSPSLRPPSAEPVVAVTTFSIGGPKPTTGSVVGVTSDAPSAPLQSSYGPGVEHFVFSATAIAQRSATLRRLECATSQPVALFQGEVAACSAAAVEIVVGWVGLAGRYGGVMAALHASSVMLQGDDVVNTLRNAVRDARAADVELSRALEACRELGMSRKGIGRRVGVDGEWDAIVSRRNAARSAVVRTARFLRSQLSVVVKPRERAAHVAEARALAQKLKRYATRQVGEPSARHGGEAAEVAGMVETAVHAMRVWGAGVVKSEYDAAHSSSSDVALDKALSSLEALCCALRNARSSRRVGAGGSEAAVASSETAGTDGSVGDATSLRGELIAAAASLSQSCAGGMVCSGRAESSFPTSAVQAGVAAAAGAVQSLAVWWEGLDEELAAAQVRGDKHARYTLADTPPKLEVLNEKKAALKAAAHALCVAKSAEELDQPVGEVTVMELKEAAQAAQLAYDRALREASSLVEAHYPEHAATLYDHRDLQWLKESSDAIDTDGSEKDYTFIRALQPHSGGSDAAVRLMNSSAVGDVVVKAFGGSEVQSFVRAVGTLRKVSHRNVMRVIRAFWGDTKGFIVTPYYKGGEVLKWVEEREVALRRKVAVEVVRGVEAIHNAGLVHCGISGQIVMMTDDHDAATAVVGGFGSCVRAGTSDVSSSTSGSSQHRALYLAPELCVARVPHSIAHNPAVDVFAVGVLLIQLFSSVRDFNDLRPDPTRGPAVPRDVPAPLRDVVVGMVATNASERPSMTDVASHSYFLHGSGVANLRTCVVCFREGFDADAQGFTCSGAAQHGVCGKCLGDYIEQVAEGSAETAHAIEADGARLACMAKCGGSVAICELRLSEAHAVSLNRACRQACEKQVSKQFEAQLEAERKRWEEEGTAGVLVRHAQESILSLKCPRCQQVFEDFSGCAALVCQCGAAICGFCLKDCGQDAHGHVAGCGLNPRGGELFVPKAVWEKVQQTRKTDVLRRWFERDVPSQYKDKVRGMLAPSCKTAGVTL